MLFHFELFGIKYIFTALEKNDFKWSSVVEPKIVKISVFTKLKIKNRMIVFFSLFVTVDLLDYKTTSDQLRSLVKMH